jgi:hypothetical protein
MIEGKEEVQAQKKGTRSRARSPQIVEPVERPPGNPRAFHFAWSVSITEREAVHTTSHDPPPPPSDPIATMSCCGHCQDAEGFFGERTARRDLRRYRRRGPLASTRLLLDALRARGVNGATLLDVGGGVGAIQHELMEAGLDSATQVDASTAYLETSRAEAEARSHQDRIRYVHGDFVDVAPELPPADLVTLDRVVCCYPDYEALLRAAAGRARRIVGLVYPRERWGTRLALGAANLWLRIRRSEFRVFVHPVEGVDRLLREEGFERTKAARTFLWRVDTYERRPDHLSPGPAPPAPG